MQASLPTFTVTTLNRQVRLWLEADIGTISVLGEISNLSKPKSGHLYFTLKDETAQLRCVYFRNQHKTLSHTLQDGQQVTVTGYVSLFEARGDYQLFVESLCETGVGNLYQQFEQLKTKLQTAGLFEESRKKNLPLFPATIGIITSLNAAALQDILTTLFRRFPLASIKIYPAEVQGVNAYLQLIKAINQANHDNVAEVLILARGGGSLEDLQAFNNEELALTISQSKLPIVSGVGHETDFTIADFVADLRAATPTAAACAVTPNQVELVIQIKTLRNRLDAAVRRFIQKKQLLLEHKRSKILSPERFISSIWQKLDYLEQQLKQSTKKLLQEKIIKLQLLKLRLYANSPKDVFIQNKTKVANLEKQLHNNIQKKLTNLKYILNTQKYTLHAISPLATLQRGYSFATYNKTILKNSNDVKLGSQIVLRLAQGCLVCEVLSQENNFEL